MHDARAPIQAGAHPAGLPAGGPPDSGLSHGYRHACNLDQGTRAGADVRFDRARSDSLPYPDASFDRVLSSLFFHHLAWPDKVRTAREAFRVLTPGGELHVADWGRPENVLMRTLFLAVQCLDGFENTRDNVAGRLIPLFEEAGFSEVGECRTFSTMLGTIALYRAVKSVSQPA